MVRVASIRAAASASVAAWSGLAARVASSSVVRGVTVHSAGSGVTRSVDGGVAGPAPVGVGVDDEGTSGVVTGGGVGGLPPSSSAMRVAWAAMVAWAAAKSSQLQLLPVPGPVGVCAVVTVLGGIGVDGMTVAVGRGTGVTLGGTGVAVGGTSVGAGGTAV